MPILFWSLIAVMAGLVGMAIALGFLAKLVRFHREVRSGLEPGEPKPPLSPLQRYAWWELGISLAMCLAILAVVLEAGPTSYARDTTTRLLVTALLLVGLVGYVGVMLVAVRKISKGDIVMDERDRGILARAPTAQVLGVMITLAAWSILLTEAYREQGQVPIAFPGLIFWSSYLVILLTLPIGVLIGYSME